MSIAHLRLSGIDVSVLRRSVSDMCLCHAGQVRGELSGVPVEVGFQAVDHDHIRLFVTHLVGPDSDRQVRLIDTANGHGGCNH